MTHGGRSAGVGFVGRELTLLNRIPRRVDNRAVRHRRFQADAEGGFSLVELFVSMAVFSVLIGFAVPTFLTASARATDRRAETTLRTASKTAWTYVIQHSEGFASDAAALAELEEIEPGFVWVGGAVPSGDDHTVSVADDADGAELALAVRSDTGTCTYLRLSLVTVESQHTDDSGTECLADDYVDGPNTGW